MAFDGPYCMDGAAALDAEIFRRAIGTLISPAGGIVTPGDLTVTQNGSPNMSCNVGVGEVWVPGSSTPTQGPYYSRNGAAINAAISASSPSLPRVDQIVAQIEDAAYAGSNKDIKITVVAGTPTSGAALNNLVGLGAVPASSLLLAYVLVPANATTIVTADIANVAPPAKGSAMIGGQSGSSIIATSESRTNTAYGTLPTPDQVTGLVLPTNGVIEVLYQATWQESVAGAARAAIFIGSNQLKIANTTSPVTQAAQTGAGAIQNTALPLFSHGGGLASLLTAVPVYSGDVTSGQVVGADGTASIEVAGTNTTFAVHGGGVCSIFATAGTYTVGVQFKASSGSVTASNRRLYARVRI